MVWWQYLLYFVVFGLGVWAGVGLMCCFFLAGKADDERERAFQERERAFQERQRAQEERGPGV